MLTISDAPVGKLFLNMHCPHSLIFQLIKSFHKTKGTSMSKVPQVIMICPKHNKSTIFQAQPAVILSDPAEQILSEAHNFLSEISHSP